jgi:CheY-like chemotaxis protein
VKRETFISTSLLIATVIVFLIDLRTPLGFAHWATYCAIVALSVELRSERLTFILGGMAAILLIIGYFGSPYSTVAVWIGIGNRVIGTAVILVVTWIVSKCITLQNNLENQKASLEAANAQLKMQDWIRTGQNKINVSLQGEQTPQQICENLLTTVAEYTKACIGSFYLCETGQGFERAATYSYTASPNTRSSFGPNEGLIGQAAAQAKLLRVDDVPQDYIRVESSFGHTVPKQLVIVPVVFNGEVKGVMELGFLKPCKPNCLDLLEEFVMSSGGILLNTALNRFKVQELLEETQQQAEELQAQQEELRVSNEELMEQSRALQEAQARMEEQQTFLQARNAELQQQRTATEAQKRHLEEVNVALSMAKNYSEQQTRELAEASRYKSEFLANMSHELRTPLNSMLIMAQMLAANKKGNLNEEQLEFAQTIHNAGNDLLALINDVLDLAKVESGKLDIISEKVSLAKLAQSAEEGFVHLAKSKGLKFEVEVEKDAPKEIETDSQRLEQIVKNFVSNAIKFTEKGSVKVRIERPKEPGSRFAAAIAVQDTGIGIPEEKHALIFEAFKQVDGTIARKYGGTGLGLSISRELAKLLQCEIKVESKPGEGSTFRVYIPPAIAESGSIRRSLGEGGQTKNEQPEPTTISGATQKPDPSPPKASRQDSPLIPDDRHTLTRDDKKLLVIEDDLPFGQVLGNLVRERGFKFIYAHNGELGIEAAQTYRPEGILLDVRLPDISGMEVLDRLKQNATTRHIPVHVISAMDYRKNALYLGAVGFIMKPVSVDDIQEAISRVATINSEKVSSVLVVEDDENLRKSMAALLEGGDKINVTAVGSAHEALDELEQKSFDCIILDLKLPDMSGTELLETISGSDKLPHPPVIVYTGKRLSLEEEERIRRYADSIIIKGARSPERLLDEMTLFLHRLEADLSPHAQEVLKDARVKGRSIEGAKVMLVDDDMRNLFALVKVLEESGAEVLTARNGEEALKQLEKHPDVQATLMDVMMPVMDGLEATRRIRKQKRFSKLPIIALTAKAMKGDREKCIEAGASDYLPKPVDLNRLMSLLRVWLAPQGI